ncbi:MAG: glyoxalase/bleomycin resistance/extradiol dioxygenase family protein [Blastocatellia bacterium]|nr:MAG: glyoxalase/bleomycin resistance/extradiol dioxygenase family protein [Blastocatellia bacterium]
MLLGLRTAVYYAEDVAGARDWYSSVLGIKPYFDEPFYVGFNVGGYELGLHPIEDRSVTLGNVGVAYWGVDNAEDALSTLLEHGATRHHDVQDVGGDIKVASVKDPFGNVLGIIENPHFKI